MKKNKNIEIIRAIAIILVVIYHIQVVTNTTFSNKIIQTFIEYGGIVGVSTFFLLSGYGIYLSINKKQEENSFSYVEYMKKRFLRIAPQYYISLIFLLLFTPAAIYLSKGHFMTIASHFLFFHNIFYQLAGAISGVCWTIGVFFQFYLIAPFLWKLVKKYPRISLISSFLITIFLKYLLFHFVLAPSGIDNDFIYLTYGNQVITALQFFVAGMFLAKNYDAHKKYHLGLNIFGVILSLIALYGVLRLADSTKIPFLNNTGIFSDCMMGYIWYALLTIPLALGIYFFQRIKLPWDNIIGKVLLFISDNEYGIYIWHLLLIEALCKYSPAIQNLVTYHSKVAIIVLFLLSVITGWITTQLIDSINFSQLWKQNQKIIWNMLKLIGFGIIVILIYKSISLIKPIIFNIKTYATQEIVEENDSKKIADNVKSSLDESYPNCKYIYIDTEETGYLYFYQLRYYLSPCESIHYNQFVYTINYTSADEIYRYLKESNVDYAIVRENEIIEQELKISINKQSGNLFKINMNALNLEEMLIPIK